MSLEVLPSRLPSSPNGRLAKRSGPPDPTNRSGPIRRLGTESFAVATRANQLVQPFSVRYFGGTTSFATRDGGESSTLLRAPGPALICVFYDAGGSRRRPRSNTSAKKSPRWPFAVDAQHAMLPPSLSSAPAAQSISCEPPWRVPC